MSSTKDPLETMIDELIHRDQAMLKGLFSWMETSTDFQPWCRRFGCSKTCEQSPGSGLKRGSWLRMDLWLFPDSASTDTDLVIWMSGASFAPGCPNESSHTSRRNFSLDQIQREGLVAILRDTLQNGLDELGFIET